MWHAVIKTQVQRRRVKVAGDLDNEQVSSGPLENSTRPRPSGRGRLINIPQDRPTNWPPRPGKHVPQGRQTIGHLWEEREGGDLKYTQLSRFYPHKALLLKIFFSPACYY